MSQDPMFLVTVNVFVAVALRSLRPHVFSALVLAGVVAFSAVYLGASQGEPIVAGIYQVRDKVLANLDQDFVWPAEKNRRYPDLSLVDHLGENIQLSSFAGKVILLQPIEMSCPACVAFAGGSQHGDFHGVAPQSNLESIEQYAAQFGAFRLDHPDLIYIQLILFNDKRQAPSPQEIAAWKNHFGRNQPDNYVVLGGTPELATAASEAIVPGFQLIDKDFVLRMDSTGEQPADDLYLELLPSVRNLLER